MPNKTHKTKVRDMKPSKDAKGGGPGRQGAGREGHTTLNTKGVQGAGRNDKSHQDHGGGGHN
jgi:hypothetical protein